MSALYCNDCRHSQTLGLSERLAMLRRRGKLVRDKSPDPAIVEVLFEAELPHLTCPQCGGHRLEQRPDPEETLDGEQWGEARRCVGCGQRIHPERLEILPETRQCAECATAGRTGEPELREFCPRCGGEMQLAPVATAGLARYAMRCTQCGSRG